MVDRRRKDHKEKQKQDEELTALQPAVVFPVLIDAPPAIANTPTPTPDAASGWDSGFSGGDTGGGGGGGDF